MRILHYFLGFERAGGLNRYAADLADVQAANGHEVFVLFPAGSVFYRGKSKICRAGTRKSVKLYKLLGGRPVTLLDGVKTPEMITDFSTPLDADNIRRFCDEIMPDIFHIHSWMGFPDELLPELKKRGVKVIYTTHDYFGFCPKVNFIDASGCLCESPDNHRCSKCNATAPGAKYLALRNSPVLLKFKNIIGKILRFLPRKKTSPEETVIRDYDALRQYYLNLWQHCDAIHCNSCITENIYRKYLPEQRFEVIPITNSSIVDRRREKDICTPVKLTFIGAATPYKGLPVLLDVLRQLREENITRWTLNIWGNDLLFDEPWIKEHGKFSAAQQQTVFAETDLLIVPSICYETFGLVVSEALSFGVPVLCSDMVGAKMLLPENMIFHGRDGLHKKLKEILKDPEILKQENKRICHEYSVELMSKHGEQILNMYTKIIQERV